MCGNISVHPTSCQCDGSDSGHISDTLELIWIVQRNQIVLNLPRIRKRNENIASAGECTVQWERSDDDDIAERNKDSLVESHVT